MKNKNMSYPEKYRRRTIKYRQEAKNAIWKDGREYKPDGNNQ